MLLGKGVTLSALCGDSSLHGGLKPTIGDVLENDVAVELLSFDWSEENDMLLRLTIDLKINRGVCVF